MQNHFLIKGSILIILYMSRNPNLAMEFVKDYLDLPLGLDLYELYIKYVYHQSYTQGGA